MTSPNNGWCLNVDSNSDNEINEPSHSLTLTFSSAKIIEKLRFEKIETSGYPTKIRLRYSTNAGMPLKLYKNVFGDKINETSNDSELIKTSDSILMTGSEVMLLAHPIEAQVLRIELVEFKDENLCGKIDVIGCQKTSCIGMYLFIIQDNEISQNLFRYKRV